MSPRKASTNRPAKKSGGAGGDGAQRLNRLLAAAGFGSRRQVEDMIRDGRVMIDGDIVTELATTVDPKEYKVLVDGVLLRKQKLVYYAVNKPTGVVTTNSDPHGRARIVDFVPPSERVFPVGRLDRSSDGLILLTNDGDLAQRLAHPKFGVQKVYRVTVAGQVNIETMKKMRKGIYIAEGLVQVDGARILKTRGKATDMEIILREGKNREIRRILARFGHKVQTLTRIAIGPLRLGDMPSGAYRTLTKTEVQKLHTVADVAERTEANAAKARAAGEASVDERRGPKKRVARKTSGAGVGARGVKKRTGSKAASSTRGTKAVKKRVTKNRKGTSPAAPRVSTKLDLSKAPRVGAVIGGDAEPAKDKKKPRDKSHIVTARPKGKSSAKKAAAKKSAGKPSGKSTGRKRRGR